MALRLRNRSVEEDQKILQEKRLQKLSERAELGDFLVEKWSKSAAVVGEDVVGKGNGGSSRIQDLYESGKIAKARNWAIFLENINKAHTGTLLREAQTSSSFTGITPNHVMKVISYAYPNSVRGDIFHEWAATTTKDSFYFLTRQYNATKRGATAGTNIINSANTGRGGSEIESESADETPNGSTTTFTLTAGVLPVVPYSLQVILNGVIVGRDDGNGSIENVISGATTITSGTIVYSTGAISVVFGTAPATGSTVVYQYNFDSEDSDNFDETMTVRLGLREETFRTRPYPLNLSWNRMTSYELGSTLDIDVEQQYIMAAGDEIKAGADRRALSEGYRYAKNFTPITFDADFAAAGADDPAAYADTFVRTLKKIEASLYTAQNKGGVDRMYAGADIVGFLSQSRKWVENTNAIKIGPYLAGTYNGIPVYQAEGVTGMASTELVAVFKSSADEADAFLSYGVFMPMALTQQLEYANFETEMGAACFEDHKKLNDYGRVVTFTNL